MRKDDLSRVVWHDTQELDEAEVTRAAIETRRERVGWPCRCNVLSGNRRRASRAGVQRAAVSW